MNFLTPIAFLGGLIAIPIILLYMLRLRRREITISSTFLWQQVLQDREANTPWQRLRRNLLLILQLIILALLVLALARPFMTVPAVSAGQVTLLLDASASMNAIDMEGGRSRFEAAKDEALSILETLSQGDHMTVIRVADVPEVLAPSTTNRGQLRDAIRSAQPGLSESDWDAALNLAAAGGASAEDFTVVIVGDGGIPDTAGIPGMSGELRYIPVGISGDNVAITAMATDALPGESPELYAQITNYSDTEARVVFSLRVDGELFASRNEVIPARGTLPITSSALPADFLTLEATLTQSVNALAEDYLSGDDVAFAVSGEGGDRRVLLVTDGNIFLEQVLRSLPGLDTVRTDGTSGIPDGYDIYVLDEVVPNNLPDGDILYIDPALSSDFFTIGAESTETENPRVLINDPRTEFVDVDQFHLLKFRELTGVDWADPLITVAGGSVLLAGEVDGRQIAVMPFDLRESDLALQITWPVLMSNLMEWFTPRAAITISDSLQTGESLLIRPPFETDSIQVSLPDGSNRSLPVDRQTVIFAETLQAGIYELELRSGDDVVGRQPFAVNLFSTLESDIAPVAQNDLQIEGTTIAVDEGEELGQREYWPFVALLALLILLIEWYAYHRRMKSPTVFRPLTRRQTAT